MFELKIINQRTYPISVLSISEGIKLIKMVFDCIKNNQLDFEASVIDSESDSNGWSLLKTKNGYVLQFICITPFNQFEVGDGAIYAYKIGSDPKMMDWPTVEFSQIPRHCFLTRDQVEPLLLQISTSRTPEKSGNFFYDSSHWERIC